jgi:hypothetical protein
VSAGPFAVVVAEAEDAVEAAIWVDALRQAGIEATAFERGVGAALGGASPPGWVAYPVVVSSDRIGPARDVIAELAGGSVLAPFRDRRDLRRGQRHAITLVLAVTGGGLLAAMAARLLLG